jgi:exonuclease VII large subunit
MATGVCASSGKQVVFKGELRARCEAHGSGRDCRLFNLTPRRAFIESFIPHVAGTCVRLRFDLPNGHQVCATGVVSNYNFAEGFDVDFTDLSAIDHEQIINLIG